MTKHCIHDKLPVYSRGLCRRCYNYAAVQVARGMWAWAKLIAEGNALEKVKAGRKPPSWAKDAS